MRCGGRFARVDALVSIRNQSDNFAGINIVARDWFDSSPPHCQTGLGSLRGGGCSVYSPMVRRFAVAL